MLDFNLLEQLKTVFSVLEHPVTLLIHSSGHADQNTLLEMLNSIASTSQKIEVKSSEEPSDIPSFSIFSGSHFTGIRFRGIPGGHEVSSLILSILYADGKGKQPDAGIIQKIQNIKGPIRLKTYISLSCEVCPGVVQALNLMACLHDDFHHEIIDGGIVQNEVSELGIQGLPSLILNQTLIHSGRAELIDLITLLERHQGIKESPAQTPLMLGRFQVLVIGGGPAGASAAIYSARKGLKTGLIAEKLGGQLQETQGIENMISVPYTEGVKLAQNLNEHLAAYPVEIFTHRRVKEIHPGEPHHIDLESGETLEAESLIIATGAQWRRLGIPGEKEHIGLGVAFCAHCDGPFYREKKVAVIGGGNSGVEAALDLSALATHVTLLEFADHLKADQVLIEKLKKTPNIQTILKAKSTQVLGTGKKVVGLEYEDLNTKNKHTLEVDGVFVQIGLIPNSSFAQSILKTTPYGEILVDTHGRTSVPWIYAAGDVTTIPFKQIITAMGDGAKVALTAFEDRMRKSNQTSQSE